VALKQDFIANLEAVGRTDELPAARQLAEKVVDFSTLVNQLLDGGRLKFKPGIEPAKFTYHDSCHLKRTLRAEQTPRKLMKQAGYELVEMEESDMCCGMGGSYTIKLPEISAPILERKLMNIEKTGAPLVLIDCPGCVMQIGGGLDKRGSEIKVEHTAQRLLECLD
jgi:Fe-S oxidoreductase